MSQDGFKDKAKPAEQNYHSIYFLIFDIFHWIITDVFLTEVDAKIDCHPYIPGLW